MRINQFIAQATGLSRRKADDLILDGNVTVNNQVAEAGQLVSSKDKIKINGQILGAQKTRTILLHKPVGYVCSRNGQGNKTVYDILPSQLHSLKPVGRLDKDSSGLLLMTNDGELANSLTHPRYQKDKIYEVILDKPLSIEHKKSIESGVKLSDYESKLKLKGVSKNWIITMSEGKNRQIRRTFEALGYHVTSLHRTHFGPYSLGNLSAEQHKYI